MTVSENYPAIHLGGLSNRFYRNSVLCFQEQKPFVLKTVFFSHLAWACVKESVRAQEVKKGCVTFSSISCRYSSRIMRLLECIWLPLHVHLGGE